MSHFTPRYRPTTGAINLRARLYLSLVPFCPITMEDAGRALNAAQGVDVWSGMDEFARIEEHLTQQMDWCEAAVRYLVHGEHMTEDDEITMMGWHEDGTFESLWRLLDARER